MDLLQSTTLAVLEKALEAGTLRQRVIANNVANINTPGFKRSTVVFEEELRRSMAGDDRLPLARTHPAHLAGGGLAGPLEVEPRVVRETGTALRPDGNNVSLDEEMVDLAMNTFKYQAVSQLASGKIGTLHHVISEGRR